MLKRQLIPPSHVDRLKTSEQANSGTNSYEKHQQNQEKMSSHVCPHPPLRIHSFIAVMVRETGKFLINYCILGICFVASAGAKKEPWVWTQRRTHLMGANLIFFIFWHRHHYHLKIWYQKMPKNGDTDFAAKQQRNYFLESSAVLWCVEAYKRRLSENSHSLVNYTDWSRKMHVK